jgi:signal transduction histidine kinase
MLEAASAELASLDVEAEVLDLTEVLGLTVGNHQGLSERHRIVLEVAGPVPALVDPAALQQVMGHLLENAVKYSPDGGTITVSLRSANGRAEIEVADEGVGLPEGMDVFAPFQRGNRTCPGVGLGLYIVRNLVDAMGGCVRAEPNNGAGSRFTVVVPAG